MAALSLLTTRGVKRLLLWGMRSYFFHLPRVQSYRNFPGSRLLLSSHGQDCTLCFLSHSLFYFVGNGKSNSTCKKVLNNEECFKLLGGLIEKEEAVICPVNN